MMTHLHVKSTEPKAAPQPVSTVPTRGTNLVAFLLCLPPQALREYLLGQMRMPEPSPHLGLLEEQWELGTGRGLGQHRHDGSEESPLQTPCLGSVLHHKLTSALVSLAYISKSPGRFS